MWSSGSVKEGTVLARDVTLCGAAGALRKELFTSLGLIKDRRRMRIRIAPKSSTAHPWLDSRLA
jgi:hypothetical protein